MPFCAVASLIPKSVALNSVVLSSIGLFARLAAFGAACALAIAPMKSEASLSLSISRGHFREELVRYVPVRDGTRIHAVLNVGKPDKATFVFLNGLVWEGERWSAIARRLNAAGHSVIRVAFRLQPESLRLLRRGEEPQAFVKGMNVAGMAEDLHDVLLKVGALPAGRRPRIQLVGLSYGAAAAVEFASRYASAVENTVLIAPLVVPLDHYDPNGAQLRAWLSTVRFWENATCEAYGTWNPFVCAGRDFWYNAFYDALYERFLMGRVQNVPPDIHPTVYKKSIFHMVRAVKDFDLNDHVAKIRDLHLMVAAEDERPLLEDQLRAWNTTPKRNRRSLALFLGAKHGLPVEAPLKTSAWLEAIATNPPALKEGRTFKVQANR